MGTRITLKDIALESGYSANTVSRALRGDEGLPEATRKRIEEIAGRLGYIRNHAASSLRLGRSMTIAVILEDLRNMNYMLLLADIDAYLRQKGYAVMIMNSDYDQELERKLLEQAVSRNVDGVIIFPIDASENAQSVRQLSTQLPVVIMYRPMEGVVTDSVSIDDYRGGYEAGKRLIDLGHRRLLYIAGQEKNLSQVKRFRGMTDAMKDAGVPLDNLRIISNEDMIRSIAEDTTGALLSPVDYTGILAFNDDLAYRALYCLTEMDYRVGEDFSIIGFDYVRQGLAYLPRLASISTAKDQNLARTAVDQLIRRIEDPECPIEQTMLPVRIYDIDMLQPAKTQI